MRIINVNKYDVAKYPQKEYAKHHQLAILKHAQNSAALTMLASLALGCGGLGVSGPPPVEPDMITEQAAREKIVEVFSRNNISLESDVAVLFEISDTLNESITLDGYNDSLSIGYEYISEDEPDYFSDELSEVLNDTTDDRHILMMYCEGYESLLDHLTQDFIDDLRARGIL